MVEQIMMDSSDNSVSEERNCYKQAFDISFKYPVYFTRNSLDPSNRLLAETVKSINDGRLQRAVVYVDSGVADASPDIVSRIENYFQANSEFMELVGAPEVLAGGEKVKNGWADVQNVMRSLGDRHMCRQSFVVAIGGGSLLDMIGFSTSLVHRGLRLIRMPSTVLSQNDAGVGVKNAMNEHGVKNFVGTFAPPFAVINDFDFLETLSDQDWIGGVAEAFKVALIKDKDFFMFLCENALNLKNRNMAAMEKVVRRTAILHLDHIRTSGDPFEFGSSRPLDFGHWSAHKLETMSKFKLGHGQAVAIGVALDCCYAMKKGLMSEDDLEKTLGAISECGLPIWDNSLENVGDDGGLDVMNGLREFKEHLGGELTIAMPDGIGKKIDIDHVDQATVSEALNCLKNHVSSREIKS